LTGHALAIEWGLLCRLLAGPNQADARTMRALQPVLV